MIPTHLGVIAIGAALSSTKAAEMDQINILRFLDEALPNWRTNKKEKDNYTYALFVYITLGQKFLGNGFTMDKPEKLIKKINKVSQKKRFAKYILKNYEIDIIKDKDTYYKDILIDYANWADSMWKAGNKKLLRKYDKKLAKECQKRIDKLLD